MRGLFTAMIVALAGLAFTWMAPPARSSEKGTQLGSSTASRETAKFFEKEVQPILKANCFACHGGEKKIKGGLRLTSREAILQGGDSGPAVDPEKPDQSLLLRAIN